MCVRLCVHVCTIMRVSFLRERMCVYTNIASEWAKECITLHSDPSSISTQYTVVTMLLNNKRREQACSWHGNYNLRHMPVVTIIMYSIINTYFEGTHTHVYMYILYTEWHEEVVHTHTCNILLSCTPTHLYTCIYRLWTGKKYILALFTVWAQGTQSLVKDNNSVYIQHHRVIVWIQTGALE